MGEIRAPGGTPEAVVPHLRAAAREDVLQEAAEKLDTGERGAPDRLGAVIAIPKGDLVVVDLFESTVGDRHAEEIAGQVVEDARPIAGGLCVHDPRGGPHRRRYLLEQAGVLHRRAHLGAHDHRQRADGHEERRMLRRNPLRPIGGEPARSDDEMDVRVIQQGARPRVEDRDAAEWGADELGVGRERLERRRRTPHQRPIDDGLVAEGEGAQRRGQGDGDQIVRTGQAPRLVPREPARGLVPATLGTVAIAARVIAIDLAAARGALRELAATGRRPTRPEVA